VLSAIPDPAGTISFTRCRKARDGGSRRPMLKTLGSIRSLWPVAAPSEEDCISEDCAGRRDSETSPGTEALRMASRSSWSAFICREV